MIKYYDTGEILLFDVARDAPEHNDLASEMPDRVDQMHALLVAYLDEVNAIIPTPESLAAAAAAGGGMGMGMGMGAAMGMAAGN